MGDALVRCWSLKRPIPLAECLRRYGDDPKNLQIRGAEPTDCTRCPDGYRRRVAYTEGREVGR